MIAKRFGIALVLATVVVGGAALAEAAGDLSTPTTGVVQPVQYGTISDTAWDNLKAKGYHGCRGDKTEALYPSYFQCFTNGQEN